MMRSRIEAVGSYLPPRVVTSLEIETRLGTAHEPGWLEALTGVRNRRYADKGVTSSQLSIAALQDMMSRSRHTWNDVDCLIVGSITPDFAEPATANVIQEALGLEGAGFDVNNACNGFATSLQIADSFIRSKTYRCIAIVCGEMGSPFIPWHLAEGLEPPASTIGALTLGDGAGAALVTRSEGLEGILSMSFMTDPRHWRAATVLGGGTLHPHEPEKHYFLSNPGVLFEDAKTYVPGLVDETLAKAGWTRGDVDIIVGHQVSLAMTRKLTELFDEELDFAVNTYPELGNNASASIPIALHTAIRQGRLERGTKVLLVACAAGFAAGIIAIEWG
jgi:3-oxoacyl-(acyl-carrier-protein) synthase III